MRAAQSVVAPKAVLGAVSTVSILGVLPVFLFAALFVTIREDVPMEVSQLGVATSVFYAVAALCSVPAGVVCERLGPARALKLSAVTSAAALFGLSTVTKGWIGFIPWLVLGGIGDALSKPASNLGLGSLSKVGNLGFIFGIKQSSIPVTTMLSGAAVPLLALTVGWRITLVVLSLTTLLAFGLTAHRSGLPVSPRVRRAAGAARPRLVVWELPLVLLMLGAGLGVAAGATMNAFYVESAVAVGMSPSAAGTALAMAGLVNIVTRLSAGTFIDRRGRATGFPAVAKIMLTGATALVLLGLAPSVPMFIAISIIAFSAAWGWNGMYHYLLVQRYSKSPAAATGVVSLGIFGGATVGPVVFGYLAAAGQRAMAWYILAASLVAAAVSLFAAERVLTRRAAAGGLGPNSTAPGSEDS